MRALEREREATIRVLRDGCVDGRLSASTLEQRVERALAVSRRHAHIVRTDDGFILGDLGSTNGTWLGGRRVGEIEVAAGDVIELGDVPVRLV